MTASFAPPGSAQRAAWCQRPLTAKAYPYLIVDAHVTRVRREG